MEVSIQEQSTLRNPPPSTKSISPVHLHLHLLSIIESKRHIHSFINSFAATLYYLFPTPSLIPSNTHADRVCRLIDCRTMLKAERDRAVVYRVRACGYWKYFLGVRYDMLFLDPGMWDGVSGGRIFTDCGGSAGERQGCLSLCFEEVVGVEREGEGHLAECVDFSDEEVDTKL
jgi:hypothetical protein